jgi:hypothetical protein
MESLLPVRVERGISLDARRSGEALSGAILALKFSNSSHPRRLSSGMGRLLPDLFTPSCVLNYG